MIDTIEFTLHSVNEKEIDLSPDAINAKSYKYGFNTTLYKRLCEAESVYIERQTKYLHNAVLINPDDTQFHSVTTQKQGLVKRHAFVLESKNKSEFFYPKVKGKMFTPSHDYHTQFSISENSDSITFNLSIPKYFYNHNFAQWIPNFQSERFQKAPFLMYSFSGQLKHLRQRIIEFIYTFFDDLSNQLNIDIFSFDIRNVEIKRLDLCYNQHFPSNAFVMDFLTSQRKFKNSRIKKNTIIDQDYEHAFNYRHSTDGFYFKIYVKGEEFKKNDFPRLNKENKQYIENNKETLYPVLVEVFKKHFPDTFKHSKDKPTDIMFQYYENYSKTDEKISFVDDFEKHLPFKTAFLLRESMKILRYEMSFTRKYMSTLYKRELFRKNCSHWKKLKRSHDLIKRYDLSLSRDSRQKADSFKAFYKLDFQDRLNYEIYDKSLHKKHQFFIVTDSTLQSHETNFWDFKFTVTNKKYKISENDKATLNDDLFKIIYKKFQDEIEFYQPKDLQQTKSILDAIDEYNKKATEKQNLYIRQFGKLAFAKMTHTEKRKKGYSKFNKTRLKIILDKMDKGQSLKDICDDMGMSKTSFFNLQFDLKTFGVFKNTIRHKFDYSLIRTDFKPYYDKFTIDKLHHRKIFHNPQLISFDTVRQNF